MIIIFWGSHFMKRSYNIFLVTFYYVQTCKGWKAYCLHASKLSINMLIVKIHPRMKCLHNFFYFFQPGMKSHPCLFDRNEFHPGENMQTVRDAWSVFFFIMVALFHFIFLFYIKFSPEIRKRNSVLLF